VHEYQSLIDTTIAAEQSILLRYRRVLTQLRLDVQELSDDILRKVHIQEGARFLPLGQHGGAEIFLYDETTCMSTGTYKDLDACLTVAMVCLAMENAPKSRRHALVLSSAGNLGYALSVYAARNGVELFFF
jgi:threonine synthase